MNILLTDINENRRTSLPSSLRAFLRFPIRSWAFGVGRWAFALSVRRPAFAQGATVGRPSSASRSGIALVMVLGILSVMVLMAVAFAIAMRTERVAAGNYADSVRARQLVQAGLARALDDLAGKLGTNGLGSAFGGTNYPPWDVTNSYTINYTNTSTNANVLKLLALNRANEATNFVPRALWVAATNADSLSASNHWLLLDSLIYTNNDGIHLADSNCMGRVKYLIVNCSGLLDANFAGRANSVIRGMGTNPSDIAIWEMPEFTPAGGATFANRRDAGAPSTYRYETLEELTALTSVDIWSHFKEHPSNLTVYSYAPPGYWVTNPPVGVGTQVNLSGSASDLINRMSEITNAFVRAGFSQSESGVLFSNLIDYVDSDPIPTNLECCVENVPMINEVVVSNNVVVANSSGGTAGNKDYTINPAVYVECWYPFFSAPVGLFDLWGSVTFDAPGIFTAPAVNFGPMPLGAFAPGGFPFRICCNPPDVPHDVLQVTTVKLVSSITLSVKLNAEIVDQITIPITLTNENDGANNSVSYAWAECHDPRFNADPDNTNQWRKQSGTLPSYTLGMINSTWPGGLFPADSDGDAKMFVANQPLRSIAELGYLVYTNAPWKTVKLYGATLHPVLDIFGLSTNTSDILMTNMVYRGRVNCSSNYALDATAVVFADMPVDQYPGEGGNVLLMPAAQAFAEKIFSKGIFTNLSDVGRNLNSADFTFPAGLNELQKEAYFRNTGGLLNVRQNLFTIIIEAQVASGGNIPRNPVRQRAVALVWRDPYTGEMFVRSIKWLRD
ncbi:MAG: pilus assembly PilX N-terminal domain-containing protein [Kiritimatiellaeota bacterium]|nr:pilus assembly PilX N-terminal domain-containing protein [Kiritimatiellota bacterium]